MEKELLERYLSRKTWKRRLICIVLAIVLFAVGFLCEHLRQSTKEIIQGEYYTRTVYNKQYLPYIFVGFIGGTLTATIVLSDFLLCRYKTVYKGQQYLTVYRGLLFISVYVDGVEKGRSIPMRHYMLVEVWLAERVKATVHFTSSPFNLAHISFSDHTATIEV